MNKAAFFKLIDKYLQGIATPQEQRLLEEYYNRLDAKGHNLLTHEQQQALEKNMLESILKRMHVSTSGGNLIKLASLF